uniref:Uncharacterized protein n=1 Tax=Anguilla anguilla TaxID=7936 RepID=A0A0E9UUR8_ANGAN
MHRVQIALLMLLFMHCLMLFICLL